MSVCKGCKKEKDIKLVTPFEGVSSDLCSHCKGLWEADLMAALKSYGFKATTDAPETFDEIKTSVL